MKLPYPITVGISAREKMLADDYDGILPNKFKITVKKGFKYDGASIFKLFWFIIGSPFTGLYQIAAFIHDALYAAEIFKRRTCDWLFLLIMKKHGCSWLKRNIMWVCVRLFGWYVWLKHDKTEVEEARKVVKVEKLFINK